MSTRRSAVIQGLAGARIDQGLGCQGRVPDSIAASVRCGCEGAQERSGRRVFGAGSVSPANRWLSVLWPWVRSNLPGPPAVVLEIGCGRHGGFVPRLLEDGYQPLGVDPEAPEGAVFQRVEFERSEIITPAEAVIACTSLHHVAEPPAVLDKVLENLVPEGLMIVVEWVSTAAKPCSGNWTSGFNGSRTAEVRTFSAT